MSFLKKRIINTSNISNISGNANVNIISGSNTLTSNISNISTNTSGITGIIINSGNLSSLTGNISGNVISGSNTLTSNVINNNGNIISGNTTTSTTTNIPTNIKNIVNTGNGNTVITPVISNIEYGANININMLNGVINLNGNINGLKSNVLLNDLSGNIIKSNEIKSNLLTLDNGNITNNDSIYDFRINGYSHIGINNTYTPENYSLLTITTPENNDIQSISLIKENNYGWYIGYKENENSLYIHDGGMGIHLAPNSTSFSSRSDKNVKKNINYIENSLEKICKINGIYFNYNNDPENISRRVGVIAQEVEKVLPEAIDISNQEIMNVRYIDLIPLIINAIKELKNEINLLKNM